jgi:ribulose-bisphosphate carboxylase large chain
LLGASDEPMAFELRYFEIAPDGYTSREHHEHIHAIVCLRGKGALELADETLHLAPFDIAYVAPRSVHQMRTIGNEPFGFFCIVDRERDRPQAPGA